MKKYFSLGAALVVGGVLVMAAGIYLKYGVFQSSQMFKNEPAAAVPFLLCADEQAQQTVLEYWEQKSGITLQSEPPQVTEHETLVTSEPAQETEETVTQTVAPTTTEPDEPAETTAVTEPQITAMDDGWFEKTLFLGDSRTCGLRDYARSGNADYFCDVGMNVFNITERTTSDVRFRNMNLDGVLSSFSYDKVFICLGINEAGYPLESFQNTYSSLIKKVRAYQPDATIILQGIMTVGRGKAAGSSYFSLENLSRFNACIESLADSAGVYYIDVNRPFSDEDGYLRKELSGDGCHLYGKYNTNYELVIRKCLLKLGI